VEFKTYNSVGELNNRLQDIFGQAEYEGPVSIQQWWGN
jgi:hypothetical protein